MNQGARRRPTEAYSSTSQGGRRSSNAESRNFSTGFAKFAWGTLLYTLAVIVWGAFVRATGSGAGCGSHWPLCNGEVVPRSPAMETVVEFSHRVTSGFALILVVVLAVWAWRAFPRGHRVRYGAVASVALMVVEALIGAGLVLFGLVGDNQSIARAVVMSGHLANTFVLVGAITLTAWWASGGAPVRLRGQGALPALFAAGLLGMILLGMSGAIAALGDTLFPSESFVGGRPENLPPVGELLLNLRIFHPLIAVGLGAYLFALCAGVHGWRPDRTTRRLTGAVAGLYVVQLVAGVVNLALLAPIWLQMVHLLLAEAIWVALVLLAASALRGEPLTPPGSSASSRASRSGVAPAGG